SGLVITSLEQSHHLQVLTRSRMGDLVRQLGRGDPRRIDEGLAREIAARAGVGAVLVGSIRRFEETFTLELRGLEPRGHAYLFAVREEAQGKGSIPDAIDRVSARAREALRERDEDVRASAIRVAEAVTPSLEAYDHYFRGVDCTQRPSRYSTEDPRACVAELRRAVELDPTFALAWLQLAMVGWDEVAPSPADAGHAIAQALRYGDRVPDKERALIRAWAAVLANRTGDALAELDAVIREFPTDKQALYLAGDLRWHREDVRAAIPYLERVLALDPGFDYALDHLAYAHAVLGNREALVEWVPRWEAMPPSPPVIRAIVGGRLGLGDGRGAVAVARRGLALGPDGFALFGLVHALAFTGQYAELERVLRPRLGELDFGNRVAFAHALAAQGRRAEARRVLDGMVADADPALARDARLVRAVHLAGDGDAAELRAEAEALRAVDPARTARLATHLARLGDLASARALAVGLPHGSPSRALYDAVVAWRSGRIAEARGRLELLERDHPHPLSGIAPCFLRAELEAEAGDDAAALAAL
ncbi:MAG TPA: hypothetical protein VD838_17140, partial [Anaeromyxobacteraceae bacterium]|nr:hypothetical protein [Anaeromyxobacteraceae bacterium]